MVQQEQVTMNFKSQVQNQDEKQRLLKLFPKKQMVILSWLQLGFGILAILFQVSSTSIGELMSIKIHHRIT